MCSEKKTPSFKHTDLTPKHRIRRTDGRSAQPGYVEMPAAHPLHLPHAVLHIDLKAFTANDKRLIPRLV